MLVFVAWRDLRFARGRFVLIAAVVALITLLVGFLAGLTGGLAAQNVSAVLQLPGERVVLADDGGAAPSFATSEIPEQTVDAWKDAAGVADVIPVGISQSRATAGGESNSGAAGAVGVALFGLPETGEVTTDRTPLTELVPQHDDEVGLSAAAADELGVARGDTVTITGTDYTVASIGSVTGTSDPWYSHTPVIAMTPKAWAAADQRVGGSGEATLLAVSADPTGTAPDWGNIAAATDTFAQTPLASLAGLESFKSEIGSLGLMIAMLFGISALVVGAFFTVWTMQRAGDVAVLKALGASTGSLVRDALGQALIVLVIGIGVGLAAVLGLGALAGQALPFMVHPLTTIAPAAVMAALGLAGAAISLRPVVSADPLTALGSHR